MVVGLFVERGVYVSGSTTVGGVRGGARSHLLHLAAELGLIREEREAPHEQRLVRVRLKRVPGRVPFQQVRLRHLTAIPGITIRAAVSRSAPRGPTPQPRPLPLRGDGQQPSLGWKPKPATSWAAPLLQGCQAATTPAPAESEPVPRRLPPLLPVCAAAPAAIPQLLPRRHLDSLLQLRVLPLRRLPC